MNPELKPLVLDLVAFVARGPRPYSEVMDAWRTSCPRLTVWEDAVEQDLVRRVSDASGEHCVEATEKGITWLERAGRRERPASATRRETAS